MTSKILRYAVKISMTITVVSMAFLVIYVLVSGIPYLKLSLFALEYNSENVSILPSIFNTLILVFGAILVAGPLGIFAAIYLVEYARRGNKIVSLVRLTAETLSGIPSIVYGLFGNAFFVHVCGLGTRILSGSLTIALHHDFASYSANH